MRFGKNLLLVALFSFVVAPSVWAANVTVVGDLNYSSATNDDTMKSKIGYGGGLLFELPMSQAIGFELGGIYMRRSLEMSGVKVNFPYLQIPGVFKFSLNRMIVLDAGGYYAMGMGDITTSNGASASYSNMKMKKSDYGLIGGLGLRLPMSARTAFVMEGRYQYGLAKVSDTGADGSWRGIQGLVGLRFRL